MDGLEFSWVECAERKLNSYQLITTIPHSDTEYALLLLIKLGNFCVYISATVFFSSKLRCSEGMYAGPILNI